MGALHLAFAAIAVGFGMKFLARGFEQLNARFGGGLRVWTLIFVLVLLQMTAALRPILGTSDAFLPAEKKFLRQPLDGQPQGVEQWSEQALNDAGGLVNLCLTTPHRSSSDRRRIPFRCQGLQALPRPLPPVSNECRNFAGLP